MSHRVQVRQLDTVLNVEEHQTILEVALGEGLDYPCGCQSGNCGACKSILLSGEVEMAEYSDFALTDEEKDAGMVLACRSMPRSDVEIAWIDPDEAVAHPQRRMTAEVVEVTDLTHDIKRIRLAIRSGGPFTFSAGQYATVTFDGMPPRDYSMANLPDGGDSLEFFVRVIPGGTVSAHVLSNLKPGDTAKVEGPRGISYLREQHRGPILALAGGSGMSPVKSIVDRALQVGLKQPIHIYFGVRDERDLFLEDYFRGLAEAHDNVTFIPVLSEPSGPTERRTGLLCDVIAQDFTTLDGAKIYLAGSPPMVETCVTAVLKLGARREDSHADAFYTEADKAKLAMA